MVAVSLLYRDTEFFLRGNSHSVLPIVLQPDSHESLKVVTMRLSDWLRDFRRSMAWWWSEFQFNRSSRQSCGLGPLGLRLGRRFGRRSKSNGVETLEERVQLTPISGVYGWAPLDVVPAPDPGEVSYLRATEFEAYRLDVATLTSILSAAPQEFSGFAPLEVFLPNPNGGFSRFAIVNSPIMAPELAAEFPEIKTYAGQGIDDPAATIRMDITPAGFHAQILSPSGTYYVDPYYHLDPEFYASYFRSDLVAPDVHFDEQLFDHQHDHKPGDLIAGSDPELTGQSGVDSASIQENKVPVMGPELAREPGVEIPSGPPLGRSGTQLRTYRTAVAASGEYVAFHGGTVSLGQAAIVTAMNRVSGIYESELSIRLQLVANNSALVYTNAATDPYSNSNPDALLTQNQANIDTVIGSANYDIGHVFTTGGGGLAGLGVVGINGQKAKGETGSGAPVADAFYVDYVAHEMGHQFGGNHTFNGINGATDGNQNSGTAYEPGSGTTIQAYAGISGSDDLQDHSDPYFHSISFDEIINHVDSVIPGVGLRTNTGNSVPTVEAGANYTIPAQTPFQLTAVGNDSNAADILTYSWEERDLGPFQAVSAGDNGSSPLFRVFNPTTDPSRTFPRLSDLLNNTTVIGERLPTTTRKMDFRVTVRDNRTGGAGVNSDDMRVNVVNTGAAFAVTSPNTAVSLPGLSSQTVSWNVAGTTGSGINTAFVNILLSTDGGNTFSTVLAANVPNDGSESIVLPNLATSQARVKVEAVGNIFFDLSNVNFTVSAAVSTLDFGDAPDSYGTLLGSNGPRHTIGGPRLGTGFPDGETNGQPNVTATGDGADEDGISLYEPLVAGTTSQLLVTSSAGGGILNYFFDFDGNGVFGNQANEIFSTTLTGGVEFVPVTIPVGVSGPQFARFRISTAGGLTALGAAADGEVEDYRLEIFATPPVVDFGDAPDPSYPTLAASSGASHLAAGPQFGQLRDGEVNALANSTATGDGLDEDGVTFPQIFQPGSSIPVRINASVGSQLNAFFDWNRNGIWGDVSDEVVTTTLVAGVQTVTVTVPSGSATGVTYARFRVSSAGGLAATGFAADGEVEDYQILIVDPFTGVTFESFDTVTAPALPVGWSSSATGTLAQNWSTVAGAESDSGANHVFVANPSDSTNSLLTSPTVVPTLPRLKFRNFYNTEDTYDGGVLEISINGGGFTDIITAGGSFVSGGYTDVLDSGSTLAGRNAWSGSSGGYIDTIIALPVAAMNQNVRFRWRFSSDTSVGATGWRVDTIQFTGDGAYQFDYGDAPDPAYPTLIANQGAAHAQGFSGLYLGASVDSESNGLPNSNATGDDLAIDDENGVTLPGTVSQGQAVGINLTASAAGLLNAWIDFNDDGDWNDAGEQIARDHVVAAGSNTLNVVIPASATVTAQTFARFRLSTNSGLAPDGRAPDGEVEDYALAVVVGNPAVNLSVSASIGTESGSTVITVTATSAAVVTGNQTVNLAVTGAGVTGADYLLSSTVITIPNGLSTGSVTFTIQDDAIPEGTETAFLTISNPSAGLTLGAVTTQSVTIVDDDSIVSIARINDGAEATTPVNGLLRVTQSVVSAVDTVVAYTISGTATSGNDYTPLSGVVTIAAGQTSADINVNVINNQIVEGTETVSVTLTGFVSHDADVVLDSNPANLMASLEIEDDDIAVFTVNSITVGEAAGVILLDLTSSNPLDSDVVIDVTFAGGTATGGGVDYTGVTQQFTFLAGETAKQVMLTIVDDLLVEPTETLNVAIATNTVLGSHLVDLDGVATLSITDNDGGSVQLVKVLNGLEGSPVTNGQFQVTQSAVSSVDTVITYTVSGSAGPGNDYVALSGTVTILAGQTTAMIDLNVLDDALVESDETVTLLLTGFGSGNSEFHLDPDPANLTATATIGDDDSATISISRITDGVDQTSPVNGRFRVSMTHASATDTVILYSAGGTATPGAGHDYQSLSGSITIAAGQVSADLDVAVFYDAIVEGDESVVVTLTSLGDHAAAIELDPLPANLTASVTIVEATTNVLAISSPTVTEGQSGVTILTWNVTSPRAVQGGFAVNFGVNEISVNGADYSVMTSGPLTFLGTANEVQTITLHVTGDTIVEANEVVSITLGAVSTVSPVNAADVVTGATGAGTILNDDTGLLTISSPSINEGDNGASAMTFTVTSPAAVQGGFTVAFTVANATTTNADYVVGTVGPLSFTGSAGESRTITVNVAGDQVVELNEQFSITLGTVVTSVPGIAAGITTGATGFGTINDNDQASFTINNVSASESNGTLTFQIATNKALDLNVAVNVQLSGGTAVGGVDYQFAGSPVTFLAGETTKLVVVTLVDNNIVEATETFNAALSSNTVLGTRAVDFSDTGVGTILDNDRATFAINNASVNENAGVMVFNITTNRPLDLDLALNVAFTDQSATGNIDYVGHSQAFTLTAGQTSHQITVSIDNDNVNEVTETFLATLGTTSVFGDRDVLVTTSGIGTIIDNDAATFAINNVSALEGGSLVFDLSTNVPFDVDVSLDVTFADATATGSGSDYSSATQRVTFLAGQTSRVVTVAVNNDTVVEETETFAANLLGVIELTGRIVNLNDTGIGTILDNDTATVSIARVLDGVESNVSINGRFRVTQTATSSTDTVVKYLIGGVATPGSGNDYATLSGTVTIPAGQLTADIDVLVANDAIVEGTETVVVTLSGLDVHDPEVTLSTLAAQLNATVSITDSDTTQLTLNHVQVLEGQNGQTLVTYQVTSPVAVQGGFSVAFDVTNISTSANDYQVMTSSPLVFTGLANETRTISIQILGDTIVEGDEQFRLSLGTVTPVAPVSAASIISGASDLGTIMNDDSTVLLIDNPTIIEGDSGSSLMTFQVASPAAVQGGFTVAFDTANITANQNDYSVITPSPLIFAGTANEVQTITVSIAGDHLVERSEQLRITLGTVTVSAPVSLGSVTSGAAGIGTIADNDTARFTIDSVTANEADGVLLLTLVTDKPLDTDVTVVVQFNNLTAQGNGIDFNSSSEQVTFLAGQLSQPVSVAISDDSVVEASEAFQAVLSTTTPLAGRSVDLGDTGMGTIVDNDTATFTINNVTVAENSVTMRFDLATNKPLDQEVTISVSFASLTATGGGVDFTGPPLQITFPAGLTLRPVTLLISEDEIVELDETFSANLAIGSVLGGRSVNVTDTGIGTIADNDAGSVSIIRITDGDEAAPLVPGQFLVTQSKLSSTDTLVTYSVAGTATGGLGSDYLPLTGTVTIPAGQVAATIDVSVIDDAFVESTESVIVTLTGFSARDAQISLDPVLVNRMGTVLIIDDDELVLSNVAPVSVVENTATSVVLINAESDPASAPGQVLIYSLSGLDADEFVIDGATGEITFRASPDFDLPADQNGDNVYQLVVTVTANTSPVRSTSIPVTLTVTGLNDNAPIYLNASPNFVVAENSVTGTVVGVLTALDADRPVQSIAYSIVSGNAAGAFAIDPVTGQVTVANSIPLNFEATPTISFTVRATDQGSPVNFADAVVNVHVSNVFEGPTIVIGSSAGTFQPGTPTVVAPNATFTYDDIATPSFAGSTLMASVGSGRQSRDILAILKSGDPSGTITVKRRNVLANGEIIGSFSGGKGRHPNLVVQLNQNATTANVNALMGRISFASRSTAITTRVIQLQLVNVQGFSSNVATRQLTVR